MDALGNRVRQAVNAGGIVIVVDALAVRVPEHDGTPDAAELAACGLCKLPEDECRCLGHKQKPPACCSSC